MNYEFTFKSKSAKKDIIAIAAKDPETVFAIKSDDVTLLGKLFTSEKSDGLVFEIISDHTTQTVLKAKYDNLAVAMKAIKKELQSAGLTGMKFEEEMNNRILHLNQLYYVVKKDGKYLKYLKKDELATCVGIAKETT